MELTEIKKRKIQIALQRLDKSYFLSDDDWKEMFDEYNNDNTNQLSMSYKYNFIKVANYLKLKHSVPKLNITLL